MNELGGHRRGSLYHPLALSFQGKRIPGSNLSCLLAVGCPSSLLPLTGPSRDATSTSQKQGSKRYMHWCSPMMATSPGHPPHAAPLSPPNRAGDAPKNPKSLAQVPFPIR